MASKKTAVSDLPDKSLSEIKTNAKKRKLLKKNQNPPVVPPAAINDFVFNAAIGDTNEIRKHKHKRSKIIDPSSADGSPSPRTKEKLIILSKYMAYLSKAAGSNTEMLKQVHESRTTTPKKRKRNKDTVSNNMMITSNESAAAKKKDSAKHVHLHQSNSRHKFDENCDATAIENTCAITKRKDSTKHVHLHKSNSRHKFDKDCDATATENTCALTKRKDSTKQVHLHKSNSRHKSDKDCDFTATDNIRVKKKKKRFRKPVESKQIQVNTLSGNTATAISTISTHKYENSILGLREIKASTTLHEVKMTPSLQAALEQASQIQKVQSFIHLPARQPQSTPSTKPLLLKVTDKLQTPPEAVDIIEEIPLSHDSNIQIPIIDPGTSIGRKITKACVQYSRVGQQALSLLNDEVSAALRDSFCSIDDIQMRIRHTIDEINECDKLYQQLKSHNQLGMLSVTHSTPDLTEVETDFSEIKDATPHENLLHALSMGLVQIQSENQMRLAVLADTDGLTEDFIIEDTPPTPDDPIDNPSLYEEPILPKLIPIAETAHQPCTKLKQEKRNVFNIPPCLSPLKEDDDVQKNATIAKPKPRAVLPKEAPAKKLLQELKSTINPGVAAPALPKIMQASTALQKEAPVPPVKNETQVAVVEELLSRSKGQANLHNKLVKEFEVTDSLLEFQRQMKQVDTDKKRVEIYAEELFIPEKKINRIAATNLSSSKTNKQPDLQLKAKTCQFLYREKTKKKEPKRNLSKGSKKSATSISSMQEKYPDSVLFSQKIKVSKKDKKNSHTVSSVSVACSSAGASNNDLSKKTGLTNNFTKNNDRPELQEQQVHFKTGLDCFDILDEITLNDLKPFDPEYPRKDHITSDQYHRPVQETYLYKLMYGSCKNQWKKLLRYEEPVLHCQSPECTECLHLRSGISTKDHANSKKNAKKVDAIKPNGNKEKDISKRLTRRDGITNNLKESCSTNPVSSTNALYTNSKQKQRSNSNINKRSTSLGSGQQKQAQSKSKKSKRGPDEDVAKRLRPYMFDPQMRYPTTITVMPVMVTTYANPNFVQYKKNQSGDFATTSAPAEKPPNKSSKPIYKAATPNNKKLWNNKYPKTASYNLMSYLQKQNSENPQPSFGEWDENPMQNTKQFYSAMAPKTPKIAQGEPNYYMDPPATAASQVHAVKPPVVVVSPLPLRGGPTKMSRKPVSPRSLLHKHAAESRKLLKDIQKLSQKTKLETSIQSVIDMIENKIVDILSCPEKSHSEAFKTVEAKIVDILNTIQLQDSNRQLPNAKDRIPDTKPPQILPNVKQKYKMSSQSTSNLVKVRKLPASANLKSGTEPQLLKLATANPSVTTGFEVKCKLSNEERFVVTASYGHNCSESEPSKGREINNVEELNKDPMKIVVPLKDHDEKNKTGKNIQKVKTPKPNINKVANMEIQPSIPEKQLPKETAQVMPKKNEIAKCNTPIKCTTPTKFKPREQENIENVSSVDEQRTEKQFPNKETTKQPTDIEIKPAKAMVGLNLIKPVSPLGKKQGAIAVTSEEFLTPFMQALKHFREGGQSASSAHILEFLDTLTNISQIDSSHSSVTTIHYKHNVQMAYSFHEPVILYPVTIDCPITITAASKDVKVLFQCQTLFYATGSRTLQLTDRLKNAMKVFSPLNLNKYLTSKDSMSNVKEIRPTNFDVICCRMDRIIPKRFKQQSAKRTEPPVPQCQVLNTNSNCPVLEEPIDCEPVKTISDPVFDHASLLNSIYGMLFTVVFFGLTFNYSCQ